MVRKIKVGQLDEQNAITNLDSLENVLENSIAMTQYYLQIRYFKFKVSSIIKLINFLFFL
ncbi:MAG: hypothetical protein COZ18_03200 [Flexibacter sp. CG_4_10_14_3_um_filter_32_15]|nr:MAG: hypothetical protein COZ18_03200 [Flexibacter sp. CG_4_10_14_3_um_filter_32_15]